MPRSNAVEQEARRLVDVQDVADHLCVSHWWVRRHVSSDETFPFKKVGRHLRFDLGEVDAWVEQNSRKAG